MYNNKQAGLQIAPSPNIVHVWTMYNNNTLEASLKLYWSWIVDGFRSEHSSCMNNVQQQHTSSCIVVGLPTIDKQIPLQTIELEVNGWKEHRVDLLSIT